LAFRLISFYDSIFAAGFLQDMLKYANLGTVTGIE